MLADNVIWRESLSLAWPQMVPLTVAGFVALYLGKIFWAEKGVANELCRVGEVAGVAWPCNLKAMHCDR